MIGEFNMHKATVKITDNQLTDKCDIFVWHIVKMLNE